MELGHDRLSTYGIGADQSAESWAALLRQLIHHGYLVQDVARYSVLTLTAAARPLLRGEARLELARPRQRLKAQPKKSRPKAGGFDYDEALFERLRVVRKRLADAEGVPPFVIFADVTLAEMAATLPTSEAALLAVGGVGRHKLRRFGEEFLDEIISYIGR